MNTVTLNELVDDRAPICYGILMPGPDTDDGIPVVKVRDYDHRGIDRAYLIRAAPEIEAPYRRSRLEPGDILVSIRGTTGVLTVVPPELKGANITQDTARIRVDPEIAPYLYQALHAPFVQRQIRLHTIGQAVRGINIASVRNLRIPWPDAIQRRAIAGTLRALDCRTQMLHTLHVAKVKFKRGLAQQLLTGKKRFATFRSNEWPSSALGKHVKPVKRKNRHGCELVLTASGEHGLVDQRDYFNRKVSASDLSGYYALRLGEFAYNRSAMNGYPYGAIKRLDAYDEGVLSTLYSCFAIGDANLDSDFLQHVFDSGLLNPALRRIVKVGARAHGLLNVADADFYAVHIPLPEWDEQKAIAAVLNGVDREIKMLEEQRQQYVLYKRGLMQRLLSGEIQAPA